MNALFLMEPNESFKRKKKISANLQDTSDINLKIYFRRFLFNLSLLFSPLEI